MSEPMQEAVPAFVVGSDLAPALVMRHHPTHDLSRTYRCVSILLGRAALRADQHVHLLFPPVTRVQCAKALWHMPPGNPAFATLPKIGANPTLDRRTNMISGPGPRGNATPLGPSDPSKALVGLPADS